ncbi:hypothetical protein J0X14_17845 [Muricauda sp. CAU 1633]|uniref:hypothetical protein n=1 Tax=Allomuricauda sp. CAU 1633 TaxID=2816036 RepID=UPI001A8C6AEF|nr:hypothetical protein [Muricauda sp. CAU 1633]MBO0324177.1 hypothetical protein [Muricauda sp. CAU 1633]
MSSRRKNDPNFHFSGAKIFEAVNGVDEFIKTLEREFFAEAKMQCHFNSAHNKAELILDLNFNFGLTEILRHFNGGDWGNFSYPQESQIQMSSSFTKALEKLNAQNSHSLDIVEASFHYKDTSIVVSRTSEFSIPKQTGAILAKISEHFVYFTKGLTEMPYEVFVPVYEGNAQNVFEPKKSQSSYFDYWGLYFEDKVHHRVMIYSLNDKELCHEDLFLLE